MNTIIKALALSLAIAAPAISFAESTSDPVTRAQVEGQLVQLDQAGYKPSNTKYPADIQAAEARVAARGAMASKADSSYGGTATSTSQSGDHVSHHAWNAEYGHH
ncbi:DUF4148 domain-containing protein [Paraburkholderia heleia]|uniref:DUF4148 domain-containing protein n=1 Tax=Paraburkholderia heleia TaxID=634127 RepID=UPI0005A885D8|nr:DUF4148 domain-containing protein [Paraburkholderia heleia]